MDNEGIIEHQGYSLTEVFKRMELKDNSKPVNKVNLLKFLSLHVLIKPKNTMVFIHVLLVNLGDSK